SLLLGMPGIALRQGQADDQHQAGAQGGAGRLGVGDGGGQPGGDRARLHHIDQPAARIDLLHSTPGPHPLAGDPPPPRRAGGAGPTRARARRRSSSWELSVAATMMMAMVMTRPFTTTVKSPLAAAAMAMALSRLIAASAAMRVQIAAQPLACALMSPAPSSS